VCFLLAITYFWLTRGIARQPQSACSFIGGHFRLFVTLLTRRIILGVLLKYQLTARNKNFIIAVISFACIPSRKATRLVAGDNIALIPALLPLFQNTHLVVGSEYRFLNWLRAFGPLWLTSSIFLPVIWCGGRSPPGWSSLRRGFSQVGFWFCVFAL